MTDTHTIKVTQQDINEGVREQSAHCILATAIGRQIPSATFISVDVQDIRFSLGTKRFVYPSPPEVGPYVIAFDKGDFAAIKPMTLRLSHPVIAARKPRGASRLVVRATKPVRDSLGRPSRTRSFGQRVFRVNRGTA